MTSITDRRTISPGNGTTTAFTGPAASTSSDITVYLANTTSGNLTLQVAGTDYTLTGVGGGSTTATFVTAPPSTTDVVMVQVEPSATTVDGSLVDITRLKSIFPSISARSKAKDWFDFLEVLDTDADRDAVRNYTMTADLTSKLEQALYYAMQFGYKLRLPAGLIPMTTWKILSTDSALLSLNHIHIEGAGACDPRDSSNYKGTVLVQSNSTNAPALQVYGDWSTDNFLTNVRLRGFSVVGGTSNTGWLVDTRNLSGTTSSIEDLVLYVQTLGGSGLRGISNWGIRYQDITAFGVATGSGTLASGTGICLYGDDDPMGTNYGVTNMTQLLNPQAQKFGRGIQLGHFDEAQIAGTTTNITLIGGQTYKCDHVGVAIGFLQNSQILSHHVEQCLEEGWLFGYTGTASPRQLRLIGCTSSFNGGTSHYDMNVTHGTNIKVEDHYFQQTDRGWTHSAGVNTDNLYLLNPRFDPYSSTGHSTCAVNNPAANNSTRFTMDGELFNAAYDTPIQNPTSISRIVRSAGYNTHVSGATTITLQPWQANVRLNNSSATSIGLVAKADGTPFANGDLITLYATNVNTTLLHNSTVTGNQTNFFLPQGSFVLESTMAYVFEFADGAFYPANGGRVIASSTSLNDKTHPSNTSGKWQGKVVFNTTVNKPVWAQGSATTDVWKDSAGTTVNTPV